VSESTRPPRIAVCGAGEAPPAELETAAQIGRLLAERGCAVVCGGLGGAMAAVCRGAKEAGGVTIGILPGYAAAAANPWVDYPICTGLGQARNAIVVAAADAVIAVGGGLGTLSEIALALRIGRPVVLLGGWAAIVGTDEAAAVAGEFAAHPVVAATPEEAVELALAQLSPG
jgi:hypothetical protein